MGWISAPLRACAVLMLLWLAACSGNGHGLDQGGRPLASGGGNGGVLTADFNSIQSNVVTPICTTCHAGSNAPQGLHLDAANSYSQLVGVPSAEVSTLLRVKPGDPDNSYIVQKLEGHAAIGGQMPLGGPPLPAATIAVIRQWISDGALAPVAAASAAHFAAVTVTPAAGDRLDAPPTRILMAFSQELDQTQIDATSVYLVVVADDPGGDTRIVPATAKAPVSNPRALIVYPAEPLVPGGHYQVMVGGAYGSGLSSIGGERLAPNVNGGAATVVTEFTVAAAP
jgi:methionine-rich copper-binding protein CopC